MRWTVLKWALRLGAALLTFALVFAIVHSFSSSKGSLDSFLTGVKWVGIVIGLLVLAILVVALLVFLTRKKVITWSWPRSKWVKQILTYAAIIAVVWWLGNKVFVEWPANDRKAYAAAQRAQADTAQMRAQDSYTQNSVAIYYPATDKEFCDTVFVVHVETKRWTGPVIRGDSSRFWLEYSRITKDLEMDVQVRATANGQTYTAVDAPGFNDIHGNLGWVNFRARNHPGDIRVRVAARNENGNPRTCEERHKKVEADSVNTPTTSES